MGGSESVDALALHHRVGMIRGAEAELDHHFSFQLPDPRAHAGMPDLLTPTPRETSTSLHCDTILAPCVCTYGQYEQNLHNIDQACNMQNNS